MAIDIKLHGFNDLGCSETPIFFQWVILTTNFLPFAKKLRKSIKKVFEFFSKRPTAFRSFDLFI